MSLLDPEPVDAPADLGSNLLLGRWDAEDGVVDVKDCFASGTV